MDARQRHLFCPQPGAAIACGDHHAAAGSAATGARRIRRSVAARRSGMRFSALHPGKAFKMQTSFRAMRGGRSFWPEGMAFLASALDSQLHWPTSQSRRRGQRHLLTHLVGGDAADRFGQHPDPPQAMLNQLVHMFGNRADSRSVRACRVARLARRSHSASAAIPRSRSTRIDDARAMLGLPVVRHAVLRRRSRRRTRSARQGRLRARRHRKRHPLCPRRHRRAEKFVVPPSGGSDRVDRVLGSAVPCGKYRIAGSG